MNDSLLIWALGALVMVGSAVIGYVASQLPKKADKKELADKAEVLLVDQVEARVTRTETLLETIRGEARRMEEAIRDDARKDRDLMMAEARKDRQEIRASVDALRNEINAQFLRWRPE